MEKEKTARMAKEQLQIIHDWLEFQLLFIETFLVDKEGGRVDDD